MKEMQQNQEFIKKKFLNKKNQYIFKKKYFCSIFFSVQNHVFSSFLFKIFELWAHAAALLVSVSLHGRMQITDETKFISKEIFKLDCLVCVHNIKCSVTLTSGVKKKISEKSFC